MIGTVLVGGFRLGRIASSAYRPVGTRWRPLRSPQRVQGYPGLGMGRRNAHGGFWRPLRKVGGGPGARASPPRGCRRLLGTGGAQGGVRRVPGGVLGVAGTPREVRGNRVPKAAVAVYDRGTDPSRNGSQAGALAATRRIMAVMRLEVSADGGEALTEQIERC